MKTFEELGVSPEIRRAIEEMGYENPMPVQEEVIPYLLGENNDIVALAQTGTGKTAAFGLPLIQQVDVKNRVPQSLILCPTRELCLQIAGDLNDYSKYIDGLKVLPVYGGSSIDSQIRSLKRGVHVIVATPGRLIDLMQRRTVSLSTIHNVVMDEADEMLNMGFTDSINAILADVPEKRNTLLFSATMSPEISRISKNYLRNAKEITIGRKNESTNSVKHIAYMIQARDKFAVLKRIADYYPQIYGIIFCRTRKETQEIADKLMQEGYSADSLHGELSQAQRDAVMQKFRTRNIQLLVATDVAARGLDVNDLTHVINYGLPDETESYTHRSGRTGRAGKTGLSIAIVNMREKGKMREIERIIGKKFIVGEVPTGKEICEKQLIKVIDQIEKVKVNEEDIADFMPEIYRKLEWLSKEDVIKRMVSMEFNRFLEYYRGRNEIETASFDSRSDRGGERSERGGERGERRGRDAGEGPRQTTPGFKRLFINLGKMDSFFPSELISLLNSNTRGRIELGRIDLMKSFSFFEVDEKEAQMVVQSLNRANWNGRKVSVEIAGEENAEGRRGGSGEKRSNDRKSWASSDKRSDRAPHASRDERPSRAPKAERAPKANAIKSDKPSREERGYVGERGKKDDWQQFFSDEGGSKGFKGEEPDFSEEGWARRKKK
ncbi:DEAD/DEAH box helicase [Bacteroides sp.]|uniref:DEAD/DEAH box helicase n=2 Tax=Bacteroides sp. TaxID=29523 RepID=UPI001B456D67|nr:DEAD/DEAH box helicase [Bacteroides sp.]MBP6065025.1 DEAD/DEAH box helicase [Bacteroides sp.]MBP6935529.1 DEAD/DEAH box helicase [Bacteroides sp.]